MERSGAGERGVQRCRGVIKAAPGVRVRRGRGAPGPQSSGPTPAGPRGVAAPQPGQAAHACCRAAISAAAASPLIVLAAVVLWGFSGFFRVEPDELGVVLRFGKYVRDAKPGLNYHLPYPIESVVTPKVTRVNRIDIGMRLVEDLRRGTQMRDVPEESLMLTGDENIVDVDFSVFWLVKPGGAGDYLFNIQNPEGTVKAVAESAMREVVGRSDIQPILTGARQTIETARAGADAEDARQLRRRHPDHAGADAEGRSAGAGHRFVPRRAGRARRPASARRTKRRPTPTAWCRRRAAAPRRSRRRPRPIASRPSPRRPARPSRFSKVYDEYKKAPDVTRQRMYLETMERLFGGTDKIILDSGQGSGSGVVPYLPLPNCANRPTTGRRRRRRRREAPDERLSIAGGVLAVLAVVVVIARLSLAVHRLSDAAGAGGAARPAGARRHRARPALQGAADRQRHLRRQAHPRSRKRRPGGHRLRPEAARGRCLRALSHHESAAVLSDRSAPIEGANSRLSTLLNSALRRVLGEATLTHVVRDERAQLDGAGARAAQQRGRRRSASTVVDVRIRRADLPEQNSQAVYQRMQTERQREAAEFRAQGSQREPGNPRQGRPRRHRAGRRGAPRKAEQIARRGRCRAQPHLRRGLRQGSGLLRLLSLDAGLRERAAPQRHPHGAHAGFRLLPLLRRSDRARRRSGACDALRRRLQAAET